MPTAAEPAPTRDTPRRGLLSAKVSAVTIVLASIATLVVVFQMLNSADDEATQTQVIASQSNSASQPEPMPTQTRTITPNVTPQPKTAALAMDDHGFIDSTARCSLSQRAVVIARTNRSAMVVCRETDGTYEYNGIRLHDGASLRLDDVLAIPAGFEARNDGTTYRLSASELVVMTGEDLLSRDAVVEYRVG